MSTVVFNDLNNENTTHMSSTFTMIIILAVIFWISFSISLYLVHKKCLYYLKKLELLVMGEYRAEMRYNVIRKTLNH